MNLKISKENSYKKKNGSYYTPVDMADFIVKRLVDRRYYNTLRDVNVLEPSSGDGVFIKSLIENGLKKNKINSLNIDVVEKNKTELNKVKNLVKTQQIKSKSKIKYINKDFLEFQSKNSKKYNLIIANPPYIKKNYLEKSQITLCREIHDRSGLSKNTIKNIWTAFLISSINSLTDDGAIGFVLPSELLQVSYTKEIRKFLLSKFDKIEIVAFNEIVFSGTEQDVVIILAIKKHKRKVVSFYHVDKIEELRRPDLIKGNTNTNRESLEKWTNFILPPRDLNFLEKLKNKTNLINSYCDAQVGIVTAANSFFILNKDDVKKYKLEKYVEPIIQKSSFVKNSIEISKSVFKKIISNGRPCYLLTLSDNKTIPAVVKKYLEIGIFEKINLRYKCKLRNSWYHVPSVWSSDGFFVKRTYHTPKIMVNSSGALVTDAFYRMQMKKGYDIKSLAFSFNNTLSFIYAELEGRFYGGGVLELTPNEFKKLPVPYCKIDKIKYKKYKKMLGNSCPEEIRNYVDEIVLLKKLNLTDKELRRLNIIYKKLVKRRLKM